MPFFKKPGNHPARKGSFSGIFLPFTCWSYILRLWCCVVVSLLEKIGNLLYNGTIVNFQILTPLFDIATWLFPIAIGKVLCSYHLIYLAFDDITTVIFTIITGLWTLFFQWQPGFLHWTGNFSCSVCYVVEEMHEASIFISRRLPDRILCLEKQRLLTQAHQFINS